jgi:hypothetical protein
MRFVVDEVAVEDIFLQDYFFSVSPANRPIIPIYQHLLRCAIALSRQHIITASGSVSDPELIWSQSKEVKPLSLILTTKQYFRYLDIGQSGGWFLRL